MPTYSLSHIRWFTVLVAAGLALGTGGVTMVGWMLDVDALKSLIPGAVQMKVNTAIGLQLSALALLTGFHRYNKTRRYFSYALATVVSTIGVLTLCEYLFSWNLRIDELLFRDRANAYNATPGRMSPFSAWTFVMLGLGLGFVRCKKFGWLAPICGVQVAVIGAVSLIGYLWRAAELVTDVWLPPVAVNTGMAFLVLGLAVLAEHFRGKATGHQEAEVSALEIKVVAGMIATLLVLIALASYAYRSVVNFTQQTDRIVATQQARLELQKTLALVALAADDYQNGAVTRETLPSLRYQSALAQSANALRSLTALEAANPDQRKRIVELTALMNSQFPPGTPTPSAGANDTAAGVATSARILKLGEDIDTADRTLLAEQLAVLARDRTIMLVSLIVGIGVATVVFVLLTASVRREMSRNALARTEIGELNVQLEHRVHLRTTALNDANHRLNAFMNALANDLRQPLISVAGFGDLLDKRLLLTGDTTGQRYLHRISTAMKQVDGCAEALIELERVSRTTLWRQTVDVAALVHAAADNLHKFQPDRHVKLHAMAIKPATADHHLLRMALGHLLANAWKFTANAAHPEVRIGCGTDEHGQRMWWVQDNGAGFDMAYSAKLFLPFQRLHGVDEFTGLGTGLAIAHAVIAKHGGRIWAHSDPGQGATFFFTLGPDQPEDLPLTGMPEHIHHA
ncbi:MAG: ATP-binding protein [Pseudomonadota bacterium]